MMNIYEIWKDVASQMRCRVPADLSIPLAPPREVVSGVLCDNYPKCRAESLCNTCGTTGFTSERHESSLLHSRICLSNLSQQITEILISLPFC